jgi:phenylalanyl-tRNA synthetase beta chain
VGWLHPGVQGVVISDGAALGHLGELHPHVAKALDLGERALVLELDLSALRPQPAPPLAELPRFPAVERDVSFLIEADRTSAEIARAIGSLEVPLLSGFAPREDYRDASHVPAGQKSMLWSFTYRAPDRTLTDVEVKKAHEHLVGALVGKLGLRLR